MSEDKSAIQPSEANPLNESGGETLPASDTSPATDSSTLGVEAAAVATTSESSPMSSDEVAPSIEFLFGM